MTNGDWLKVIRRFWDSPAGQHSDPSFILKWEYWSSETDPVVFLFTARRVPKVLRGCSYRISDAEALYAIGMMMKEKSLEDYGSY